MTSLNICAACRRSYSAHEENSFVVRRDGGRGSFKTCPPCGEKLDRTLLAALSAMRTAARPTVPVRTEESGASPPPLPIHHICTIQVSPLNNHRWTCLCGGHGQWVPSFSNVWSLYYKHVDRMTKKRAAR